MTRKRFIKLMMGHGVPRNKTNVYARLRDEDESYLELYSDIMWGYDGTGWLAGRCDNNVMIQSLHMEGKTNFIGYVYGRIVS